MTVRTNFWSTLNVCDKLFPLLRPHARQLLLSSLTDLHFLLWNTVQLTPKQGWSHNLSVFYDGTQCSLPQSRPGLIICLYSMMEHSAAYPKVTWSHNLSVFYNGTQCSLPQSRPGLIICLYSMREHSAAYLKVTWSQYLCILWWNTVQQHTPKYTSSHNLYSWLNTVQHTPK